MSTFVSMRVVGLCGFAAAGKDTVSSMLHQWATSLGYVVYPLAFADALRAIAYDLNPLFGPPVNRTYQDLLQEYGYERAKREFPCVRPFLVQLGKSARQHISPSVWIDAVLNRMRDLYAECAREATRGTSGSSDPCSTGKDQACTTDATDSSCPKEQACTKILFVICDVRYINEVSALHACFHDGVAVTDLWYIERPGVDAENETERESISEITHNPCHSHTKVINDGTLDELRTKVCHLF